VTSVLPGLFTQVPTWRALVARDQGREAEGVERGPIIVTMGRQAEPRQSPYRAASSIVGCPNRALEGKRVTKGSGSGAAPARP
jgi:hypothetical protein